MSRTADTHPVEVAPEQLDRDTLQDTLMLRLRSWRRSSPQSLDKCVRRSPIAQLVAMPEGSDPRVRLTQALGGRKTIRKGQLARQDCAAPTRTPKEVTSTSMNLPGGDVGPVSLAAHRVGGAVFATPCRRLHRTRVFLRGRTWNALRPK
jgi:hypothetical protein